MMVAELIYTYIRKTSHNKLQTTCSNTHTYVANNAIALLVVNRDVRGNLHNAKYCRHGIAQKCQFATRCHSFPKIMLTIFAFRFSPFHFDNTALDLTFQTLVNTQLHLDNPNQFSLYQLL